MLISVSIYWFTTFFLDILQKRFSLEPRLCSPRIIIIDFDWNRSQIEWLATGYTFNLFFLFRAQIELEVKCMVQLKIETLGFDLLSSPFQNTQHSTIITIKNEMCSFTLSWRLPVLGNCKFSVYVFPFVFWHLWISNIIITLISVSISNVLKLDAWSDKFVHILIHKSLMWLPNSMPILRKRYTMFHPVV